MSARWNSSSKTLSICVKNGLVCLDVSNWCKSPAHRLEMIMFKNSKLPIALSNINLLECEEPYNREQKNLVTALQRHFDVASELIKLSPDSTDDNIFKKCLALNYLKQIGETLPMSRILGFESIYDEVKFQYEKCRPRIMTRVRFERVTLDDIRSLIENQITSYNIRRTLLLTTPNWPDADAVIEIYRKYVPGDEWYKFLMEVYSRYYPIDLIDFKNLDMRINNALSPTPVK